MTNIIPHSALTERELEAKVEAAIEALIATGIKPSDIGPREIEAITKEAYTSLSPAARRKAGEDGLLHIAKQVIGERMAEKLWERGLGWSISKHDVQRLAKEMRIAPTDAPRCLEAFREKAPNVKFEDLSAWRTLGRFAPLFLGASQDATLGEVATRKAARGDKLALSFLAWREVA